MVHNKYCCVKDCKGSSSNENLRFFTFPNDPVWEIRRALQQNWEPKLENRKPTDTAMILFHHTISNKISRLLRKHDVRMIRIPTWKTAQMLRSAKEGLELKVPGVYQIPYECRKGYVGHSSRAIETRCKEHQRYICLHQPKESAVAEHSISIGHCINFGGTSILDGSSGYVDRLVKEAIEIQLNKNNFNREGCFILSHAYAPVTTMLMNVKGGTSRAGT
ncbi:hypothetical protein Cfor_10855 [Coptotermes formosanus]|uniref:Uncharacterized protein n=1 Tax=Coptotermes formosanus TaxID=36987 RepID=A0A6L2PE54_COPFO|nr:hypothetical protein Cfor_10855 [Coptotermes formosanus]